MKTIDASEHYASEICYFLESWRAKNGIALQQLRHNDVDAQRLLISVLGVPDLVYLDIGQSSENIAENVFASM